MARHFIHRFRISTFLRNTAAYDVASNLWQALGPDAAEPYHATDPFGRPRHARQGSVRGRACHVIDRVLNPRVLCSMTAYDVARNTCLVHFLPRRRCAVEPSCPESNGII